MKKTHTYYRISATIDNQTEDLFGSFDRADCVSELEIEKEGWKEEGYKKFRIYSIETNEAPDAAVYPEGITDEDTGEVILAPEIDLLALTVKLVKMINAAPLGVIRFKGINWSWRPVFAALVEMGYSYTLCGDTWVGLKSQDHGGNGLYDESLQFTAPAAL
tara:strand:- start:826 stop:1308 length:483 start_codon:yes stop_codon:yes gene_type:complete